MGENPSVGRGHCVSPLTKSGVAGNVRLCHDAPRECAAPVRHPSIPLTKPQRTVGKEANFVRLRTKTSEPVLVRTVSSVMQYVHVQQSAVVCSVDRSSFRRCCPDAQAPDFTSLEM